MPVLNIKMTGWRKKKRKTEIFHSHLYAVNKWKVSSCATRSPSRRVAEIEKLWGTDNFSSKCYKKKWVTLRSKPGLNFKKTQYLGQIRSIFAYVDTNQVVNLVLQAVNWLLEEGTFPAALHNWQRFAFLRRALLSAVAWWEGRGSKFLCLTNSLHGS